MRREYSVDCIRTKGDSDENPVSSRYLKLLNSKFVGIFLLTLRFIFHGKDAKTSDAM